MDSAVNLAAHGLSSGTSTAACGNTTYCLKHACQSKPPSHVGALGGVVHPALGQVLQHPAGVEVGQGIGHSRISGGCWRQSMVGTRSQQLQAAVSNAPCNHCRDRCGSASAHLKAGAQPCWSSSRVDPSSSLIVAAWRGKEAGEGGKGFADKVGRQPESALAQQLATNPCMRPLITSCNTKCCKLPTHLQDGVHRQVRDAQLHAHAAVGAREGDLGRTGAGRVANWIKAVMPSVWVCTCCASKEGACKQPTPTNRTSICCCCSHRVSASARSTCGGNEAQHVCCAVAWAGADWNGRM